MERFCFKDRCKIKNILLSHIELINKNLSSSVNTSVNLFDVIPIMITARNKHIF